MRRRGKERALLLFLFSTSLAYICFLSFPKHSPNSYLEKKSYIIDKHNEYKNDNVMIVYHLERLSFYNFHVNQTDNDPDTASCGPIKDVKEKLVIALSQDMFFDKNRKKHLCRKKAKILSKLGTFDGVIYDTMNKRYKKSADILVESYELAINLGIDKNAILVVYE